MQAYRTRDKCSSEAIEKMMFSDAKDEVCSMIWAQQNHYNRFFDAQLSYDPEYTTPENCWVKTACRNAVFNLEEQLASLDKEHYMAMARFRDREVRQQAMTAALELYAQTIANHGGAIQDVSALNDLRDPDNWSQAP